MSKTADIIVVGGGIAGISVAAVMAPDARVVVLESEAVLGYHSSGRSAAIFILNYGSTVLRALNAASAGILEDPEGISDRSLFSPRGELLFAAEQDLAAFETYMNDADGVDELTVEEAVALVPVLRPDIILRASIERNARDIDVDRLLQGYAKRLRSHGGRIVFGAAVTNLARTNGCWNVKTSSGLTIEAPIVVNAAGAWADVIAERAGQEPIGLIPMRRSVAVLPAPDGHRIANWPFFGPVSETWYAKPESGKLLVSPAEETPVDPHDAWVDDMDLAQGLDRFESATTLAVTRVESAWAGLRNFVADRNPVVGFAPNDQGFFWLAGQGGNGVQTSPALARLTADLVLGRQSELTPEIVLALAPGRNRD